MTQKDATVIIQINLIEPFACSMVQLLNSVTTYYESQAAIAKSSRTTNSEAPEYGLYKIPPGSQLTLSGTTNTTELPTISIIASHT